MNRQKHNLITKRLLVSLLGLLLFTQALFPLQLHTEVVKAADGKSVVICTLQGYTQTAVTANGLLTREITTEQSEASAAVKFSELMASATLMPDIPVAVPEKAIISEDSALQQSVHSCLDSRCFSIRAPPTTLS